ncbi:MAG: IPT/TIG domain-containing protein [Planctomycetota bacterium]|jgi:hypothetical protein
MTSTRLRLPLSFVALAVSAVLLACGGGTGVSGPVGGPPGNDVQVFATDVDGDGIPDIVMVGADGSHDCFRGLPDGTFEPRPDWQDSPAVLGIIGMPGAVPPIAPFPVDIRDGDGVGCHGIPMAQIYEGPLRDEPAGPPLITDVHPGEAPAGSFVWIHGRAFFASETDTTVALDGAAVEILFGFPGLIMGRLPDDALAGPSSLVVTRGGVESTPYTITIIDTPVPVIDTVTPDPLVNQRLGRVIGENLGSFFDLVVVEIGDVEITCVLAVGDTVFFVVPEEAESGDLVVYVNGVPSDPVAVTVTDTPPAPTITSLSPDTAPVGAIVEITGEWLWDDRMWAAVHVGDALAPIWGMGHDALGFVVPAGFTPGEYPVKVSRGDLMSNTLTLTIRERQAPVIASVSPDPAMQGGAIEIVGTDLYDLSGLVFAAGDDPVPPPPGAGGMPMGSGGRPVGVMPEPWGGATVTINGQTVFFVFPRPDGLFAFVPFDATSGDVLVTVNGVQSNAVPLTIHPPDPGIPPPPPIPLPLFRR